MGLQIHSRNCSSYARLSVSPPSFPYPVPLTLKSHRTDVPLSGELPETHPKFPEGSKAALILESAGSGPLDLDAPVTVYDEADDAAVEKYTREFVRTAWHYVRGKPAPGVD